MPTFILLNKETMFDWEEESQDNHLNEDLVRFETQLAQNAVGFYDSDRLEAIIDHYLINGNYTKAEAAADTGCQQFPFARVLQVLFLK